MSEEISWKLTTRQLCDLELLSNGSFRPLESFLSQADYNQVCKEMRLTSGVIWPIPVVLDVPRKIVNQLDTKGKLLLQDVEGIPLAYLHVSEIWQPDKQEEADRIYETTEPHHFGVAYLQESTNDYYISGELEHLEPIHYRSPSYLS